MIFLSQVSLLASSFNAVVVKICSLLDFLFTCSCMHGVSALSLSLSRVTVYFIFHRRRCTGYNTTTCKAWLIVVFIFHKQFSVSSERTIGQKVWESLVCVVFFLIERNLFSFFFKGSDQIVKKVRNFNSSLLLCVKGQKRE